MNEKKYLTLPKKIAYGMGDSAWCFISLLVSSFMMIYLTDTVGLNPGIIGTLMLIARLFDGVTDLIFGRILDKTHTKMGKARPWMFYSMIGCAIGLAALFGTPESLGNTAKYVWFFVFYMLVNTIFYTSGYISYSTLMSLITRNREEQVQVTAYRTIAGNLSYMVLGSVTFALVTKFGGGANGWRTLGIIYAIIGIIINSISVLANKELPEIENGIGATDEKASGNAKTESSLRESLRSVLRCRYFYGTILIMLALYFFASVFQTSAAYYATYVLGDPNMMGTLSICSYGVTMCISFVIPFFAKKLSVQRLSVIGLCLGLLGRLIALFGGMGGSVAIILIGLATSTVATAAIQTTVYTMMASVSEYLRLKDGVHVNGMVFSCSSMGIKLGQGLGTAVSGILLNIGGYIANVEVQSQSAINMLNFMFLWIPIIVTVIMIFICFFMDVDKKLDGMKSVTE